eukprot:CAMPEP_0197934086 /NCGR_PEP_ID=MMETSP1439-20131203/111195_1 /TAXON_ID=66791 /ORGANISM="Gonyaulax spinifera, Strain CCMP409" /LENGTH=31 /DNA_ID= /DNA_START= /DNA_END= /DNA_ORIENTATION=
MSAAPAPALGAPLPAGRGQATANDAEGSGVE